MSARAIASTIFAASIGLGLIPSAPLPALASAEPSEVVSDDHGGYLVDYATRMETLRKAGRKVSFNGRCDSACTLFLALPIQQTCITPAAYFGFHAPSAPSPSAAAAAEAYLMMKYPGWVRAWISSKGGLTTTVMTMDYAYASRYLKSCT